MPGIPEGGERQDLLVLESLVSDLRGYAAGDVPTEAQLRAAPLIERWTPVPDLSSMRACGLILGHPSLGDTRGITSRVYAVDRGGRWMRTFSRLWRLGAQAPANGNDPG